MGQKSHERERAPYILVVGGDTRARAMIAHGAREHGLVIEPVSSVSELRPADWARADLVIAWHQSGLLNALQAEMHRNWCSLPIMLCVERPTIPEVIEMVEGGASDVIDWPVTWDHLAERIRLALRKGAERRYLHERVQSARRRLAELTKREHEVLSTLR